MSSLLAQYKNNILPIDDYNKEIHQNKVTCNFCHEKVIAKKGSIVVHHYAHSPNSTCLFTKKEPKTQWHQFWQENIKSDYLEKIITKDNKKHIADIINTTNTVIEIQHSNISLTDAFDRESFYNNMIWILDGNNRYHDTSKEVTETISVSFEFTQNNTKYYMIKSTKKFWSYLQKPKYIDTSLGLLHVIRSYNENYYLCKLIYITAFLNTYFKDIMKCNPSDFADKFNNMKVHLEEQSEYSIKNKVMKESFKDTGYVKRYETSYNVNTDTFTNIFTYNEISLLLHLGYKKLQTYSYTFKGIPKTTYFKCHHCNEICDYNYLIESFEINQNVIDDCLIELVAYKDNNKLCCISCFKKQYNPSTNDKEYSLHIAGSKLIWQLNNHICKCDICDNNIKSINGNIFRSYKVISDDSIQPSDIHEIVYLDDNDMKYCMACFKETFAIALGNDKSGLTINDNNLLWLIKSDKIKKRSDLLVRKSNHLIK